MYVGFTKKKVLVIAISDPQAVFSEDGQWINTCFRCLKISVIITLSCALILTGAVTIPTEMPSRNIQHRVSKTQCHCSERGNAGETA